MNEQYHIQLKPGDIGRYVLLPGDPGRCQSIAQFFDDPVLIMQNREFTTYGGALLGEKVAVTSTGIGAPSAAIAVEELVRVGADTFIRVGTAGGVHPKVQKGDLVIATGSVRDEGTTPQYVPIEYPAVADFEITAALKDAAAAMGKRYHCGIFHSKDSFYGEVEMERMPNIAQLQNRWLAWVRSNVLASEMESSALFIVSSILGVRAGAIVQVISPSPEAVAQAEALKGQSDWLQDSNEISTDLVIQVAVEGLKRLIRQDRQK
jgi:uridine phosphorylase